MDASFTNTREDAASARRADVDWPSLSFEARVRFLELEGYVVIPDLLSAKQLAAIRAEMARLPTVGTDYSERQRGFANVQWTDSPQAIELIALPAMVEFLQRLFGDELICTSCVYAVSQPGHPGIALHTDAQPYGSKIFGLQSSSPCLVRRVLYYLDDLTPERSPFKVIPRSHLSLHADGNPYRRYLSHEDEVMVTCRAGSAALSSTRRSFTRTTRTTATKSGACWPSPIVPRGPGRSARFPSTTLSKSPRCRPRFADSSRA